MAWVYLVAAGLFEIAWVAGFREASPQRPLLLAGVLVAMAASFALLWLAMRTIPIGTAYAVWTGIGAVGAAIVGVLIYKEPATALRLACIALIVSGIVGLKLASG